MEDAVERGYLAVFVVPEYLAHGAGGGATRHAIDVDLLVLVSLTHGLLWFRLRGRLAGAGR